MPTDNELAHYPFGFRGDQLAPQLTELLTHSPVHQVVTNTGARAWLVTGYEQVVQVLRDRRFSLSLTSDAEMPKQDPLLPPLTVTDTLAYFERSGMRDELYRGLGPHQDHLSPERVADLTRARLEVFLAGEQPGALVDDFILPLSRTLTVELLGLTDESCPDNTTLFDIFRTGSTSYPLVPDCWERATAYMRQQLPRLRRERTGLLGSMIGMSDASGVLTDEEVADLFLFLFVSNFGNPATFLGAASVGLMRHPEIMRRLRAEPQLYPRAVEELLRWTVFLGDALPRIARQDVLLDGVRIRAGELVLVSTDAANYDPRVFPDPERLDIDRETVPHVRFSHGRHRCPGAAISRMQAAVVLRTLLEETDELRMAVAPDSLAWRSFYAITLPVSLPVYWTRATPRGTAGRAPGAPRRPMTACDDAQSPARAEG